MPVLRFDGYGLLEADRFEELERDARHSYGIGNITWILSFAFDTVQETVKVGGMTLIR